MVVPSRPLDPSAPGPLPEPGTGPMPMDPMAGAPPADPMQMGPGLQPPMPSPTPPPPAPMPMEEPDDLKPVYPKWMYDRATGELKKPPKPDRAYMDAAVTDDQFRHAALINRFRSDLRTYRLMDRTIFDDLKRDDLEMYVSASPAIQVHKVANMVSNIEHVIQYPYRTKREQLAAQRMENAAYFILGEANRAHRSSGNTDMKWEWIWSDMVYGRMVTRVIPDPTDPDLLVDVKVFDPSVCFPTFGGKKGLIRMSLVYNESLDKILQTYGDDPKINKKLVKKFTDKETGKLELNKVGEVRECWTAFHRWLEFEGEDVIPVTEHSIGKVPFVYTIAPGQMGGAMMPSGSTSTVLERSSLIPLVGDHYGTDIDLTQKGLSFFHHMRPALRQQAAVMSIQMTAAKQRLNPPMEKNSPYENPGKPVSMTTGDTNYTRAGESIRPLLSQGNAVDMGVVIGALDKELQKGGLPDHLFGAMEGSNISGFAVESMIASAKDRIQTYITDLENHMAEVVDLVMYHFRNMGHLFVDDPEGKWHFAVKGRGSGGGLGTGPTRPQFQEVMGMLMGMTGGMPPDLGAWQMMGMDDAEVEEPEVEDAYLTREDVLLVGTRPEMKLQSVHLQNMTMLANVASMLIDKKIWSRERAMDEFNIKNPQAEFEKILKEDAMTNPKMLELVAFPEALYQSGNMSGFLAYFATVIAPVLMQMQMGAPGGAPPGPGGGPATVQGDSQPMMAQGQQGPTGPGNAAPPGAM